MPVSVGMMLVLVWGSESELFFWIVMMVYGPITSYV